jgi:hypothetical protein
MMSIVLRPYDIGCQPSPSVPAEMVIADGWSTYILFFAVSKSVDECGLLKDLGVAVVECQDCSASKFGYPNDEGLPEHPLYKFGLARAGSSILEVVGSSWAEDLSQQREASAHRILGDRTSLRSPFQSEPSRHFIIPLKEMTFECVAKALIVSLFAKSFQEAIVYVNGKLAEH